MSFALLVVKVDLAWVVLKLFEKPDLAIGYLIREKNLRPITA
jgi:hypothetical protein